MIKVRDKLSETRHAVGQARRLHEQVEEWERRVEGGSKVSEAAKAIKEKLSAIEGDLAEDTRHGKASWMAPARLNEKLVELPAVVASTDARPTQGCYEVFEDLSARVDVQLDRLRDVIDTDIQSFAEMLREMEIPLVVP